MNQAGHEVRHDGVHLGEGWEEENQLRWAESASQRFPPRRGSMLGWAGGVFQWCSSGRRVRGEELVEVGRRRITKLHTQGRQHVGTRVSQSSPLGRRERFTARCNRQNLRENMTRQLPSLLPGTLATSPSITAATPSLCIPASPSLPLVPNALTCHFLCKALASCILHP